MHMNDVVGIISAEAARKLAGMMAVVSTLDVAVDG